MFRSYSKVFSSNLHGQSEVDGVTTRKDLRSWDGLVHIAPQLSFPLSQAEYALRTQIYHWIPLHQTRRFPGSAWCALVLPRSALLILQPALVDLDVRRAVGLNKWHYATSSPRSPVAV